MADTNTFLTRFLYGLLPQFADGPSGVLTRSTTTAATIADTNETTLWTYDLPANVLSADGKGVRITAWGTTAATANTKTLRLYFGSGLSGVAHSFGFNNLDWELSAIVLRTGAAAQTFKEMALIDSNTPNIVLGTLTENTAAVITIKMTGLNGTAAANDIVFKGAVVELL